MQAFLQKTSYEKLIRQMVYIEENMQEIQDAIIQSGIGTSAADVRLFFEKYIERTEALIRETAVTDRGERLNRIPFIVLDSSFTLRSADNRTFYCHLTSDNEWEGKKSLLKIYFLSETGLSLLLKKENGTVNVNLGSGYMDHGISSVRIV
jgi:hypothetical protein